MVPFMSLANYTTSREAARAWGCHRTSVLRRCAKGHVPGAFKDDLGKWRIPVSEEPPPLPVRGKLTEKERREVARLAHAGENRTWLARRFNIERHHVYRLMRAYPPL